MGHEQQVVSQDDIDRRYGSLKKDAETGGYHLNPDIDFTKELLAGLLTNKRRYGYEACPCRLATGDKPEDLDIICPCDYRDPDLNEYGTCYCGLYVSSAIAKGEKPIRPIPERRVSPEERAEPNDHAKPEIAHKLPYPVWRCKVCGYLCARAYPPETCPVCKAKKERFEQFLH
jgi:ferredoxin-thioredoxin reductase catalytic subunit